MVTDPLQFSGSITTYEGYSPPYTETTVTYDIQKKVYTINDDIWTQGFSTESGYGTHEGNTGIYVPWRVSNGCFVLTNADFPYPQSEDYLSILRFPSAEFFHQLDFSMKWLGGKVDGYYEDAIFFSNPGFDKGEYDYAINVNPTPSNWIRYTYWLYPEEEEYIIYWRDWWGDWDEGEADPTMSILIKDVVLTPCSNQVELRLWNFNTPGQESVFLASRGIESCGVDGDDTQYWLEETTDTIYGLEPDVYALYYDARYTTFDGGGNRLVEYPPVLEMESWDDYYFSSLLHKNSDGKISLFSRILLAIENDNDPNNGITKETVRVIDSNNNMTTYPILDGSNYPVYQCSKKCTNDQDSVFFIDQSETGTNYSGDFFVWKCSYSGGSYTFKRLSLPTIPKPSGWGTTYFKSKNAIFADGNTIHSFVSCARFSGDPKAKLYHRKFTISGDSIIDDTLTLVEDLSSDVNVDSIAFHDSKIVVLSNEEDYFYLSSSDWSTFSKINFDTALPNGTVAGKIYHNNYLYAAYTYSITTTGFTDVGMAVKKFDIDGNSIRTDIFPHYYYSPNPPDGGSFNSAYKTRIQQIFEGKELEPNLWWIDIVVDSSNNLCFSMHFNPMPINEIDPYYFSFAFQSPWDWIGWAFTYGSYPKWPSMYMYWVQAKSPGISAAIKYSTTTNEFTDWVKMHNDGGGAWLGSRVNDGGGEFFGVDLFYSQEYFPWVLPNDYGTMALGPIKLMRGFTRNKTSKKGTLGTR